MRQQLEVFATGVWKGYFHLDQCVTKSEVIDLTFLRAGEVRAGTYNAPVKKTRRPGEKIKIAVLKIYFWQLRRWRR